MSFDFEDDRFDLDILDNPTLFIGLLLELYDDDWNLVFEGFYGGWIRFLP